MNRNLILGFIDGFRPIPRMLVSEWSNKYRYLSNIASARPGRYDMSFTPYLEEIVDNLSEHSPISRVVFMKGAQIGATEIGNNWIGSIIHIAPAATLMVMPTDDTVRRNSKIRIDPMIQASPELRKRIKSNRSRDSGNTTTQKEFPGGVLIMTGANSASALRSMPIKNLMLDEVDGYPTDLDGEGSPIELARARTNTYSNKKKELVISTPTVDELSAIQKEFNDSDRRYYHVPCPHCGLLQTIEWENIVWENDLPETAKLKCKGCDELIDERHKFWMVSKASGACWIPENPGHVNKRKRGYHLNALYSTLGFTWTDAVNQWLAAKGDDTKEKTFMNVVRGLTWKEALESPEWSNLYGRRELYKTRVPPKDVAFITAGVDIQRDRIELEIVGWCKGKVSYSIDYRVLMGDTSLQGDETTESVWDSLAAVMNETFVREDGFEMPLKMAAVDTGFNTNAVYAFCRKFDSGKVIPVKGSDKIDTIVGFPKAVDYAKDGKVVGRVRVWSVGVSIVKTELYGWLRQVWITDKAKPIGYCHFPQYGEEYFKMLTAEKKQVVVDSKGFRKYAWVLPSHARNEALDCRVYARAAATVLGMDRYTPEKWDEISNQYIMPQTEEEKKAAPPAKKKGKNFLGGGSIW